MSFGKLCQHNVGWKHVDMCTEHLQPKVHLKNKEHTGIQLMKIATPHPPQKNQTDFIEPCTWHHGRKLISRHAKGMLLKSVGLNLYFHLGNRPLKTFSQEEPTNPTLNKKTVCHSKWANLISSLLTERVGRSARLPPGVRRRYALRS